MEKISPLFMVAAAPKYMNSAVNLLVDGSLPIQKRVNS